MAWTLSIGPGASAATPGPAIDLAQASGAVLTRRVRAHHFAQFTISCGHRLGALAGDSAELVAEERSLIRLNETDLWMWRDGTPLFRGRIVTQNIQVSPEVWSATFYAVDYRGLLAQAAMIEGAAPTWTVATDQVTIARQLIAHRQAQTGGDWGITNGLGVPSGQTRTETDLTVGKPIAEAIDALATRDNGFDWEISPSLAFNAWTPRRTRNQGVQIAHPSEVESYTASSGRWGNAVTFTGAQGVTPGVAVAADVALDERGRWSVFDSSPNTVDAATLQDHADGRLARLGASPDTWQIELGPGVWDSLHNDDTGIDACDLGEIVNLVLPLDGVDTTARLVEQQITCGDDGPGSEIVRCEFEEEA